MDLSTIRTLAFTAINQLPESLTDGVAYVSKDNVTAILTQAFDSLAKTFNTAQESCAQMASSLAEKTTEVVSLLNVNALLTEKGSELSSQLTTAESSLRATLDILVQNHTSASNISEKLSRFSKAQSLGKIGLLAALVGVTGKTQLPEEYERTKKCFQWLSFVGYGAIALAILKPAFAALVYDGTSYAASRTLSTALWVR